jgi:hypothetical protein
MSTTSVAMTVLPAGLTGASGAITRARLDDARLSKLRFDRSLVDNRPHLGDSLVPEPVEDVLGEDDPPAVYRQAKKQALRPAVESQPARDMGRIADQKFDLELKVQDLFEIAFEHRAIAGEAERAAIVTRVVGDEAIQIFPVAPVQAGDVISVALRESGFGHRATLEQAAFGSNRDRHCERSEAIQGSVGRPWSLDCFVAALLAVTIPSRRATLVRARQNMRDYLRWLRRRFSHPRLCVYTPMGRSTGARLSEASDRKRRLND